MYWRDDHSQVYRISNLFTIGISHLLNSQKYVRWKNVSRIMVMLPKLNLQVPVAS
jgi:hypothetical protein